MSSLSGRTLGPYRVLDRLGEGGMGAVYLAEDTRLRRRVALKVVPPEIGDAHRLARFRREAEALAAVTHPHIVAVHAIEEIDGLTVLAMELVEGETLRERISRGPLPLPEAVGLAVALADALAEAHTRGIVHRDLKPTNLMIDGAGRLKVLDFGLAKLLGPEPAAEPAPGGTAAFTQVGLILGTVEYMSPEQAQGGKVDFRSDQFAFGLVLFEMLTGRNPFRREALLSTMAAITGETAPPLGASRPDAPTELSRIVARCLEKEPSRRYGSTRDLAIDLEHVREDLRDGRSSAIARRGTIVRRRRGPLAAGATALGLVGGVLLAASLATGPIDDRPDLSRARLVPLAIEGRYEGFPAWSPDGRNLAYVAEVGGVMQVFTRAVQAALPAQVTSSAGDCQLPFWSRDGSAIYYLAPDEGGLTLWRVGAAGGVPEPIVDRVVVAAGSPADGSLALMRNESAEGIVSGVLGLSLWTADEDGKRLTRIATPPFDELRFWKAHLAFSPDGGTLALWGGRWDLRSELWLVPWPDGEPRTALSDRAGVPHPRPFTWLPDGRHLVFSERGRSPRGGDLWIADLETGVSTPLAVSTPIESYPAASPDGSQVAVAVLDEHFDVVEIPLDGGPPRPLLATHVNELYPVPSPDGEAVAFVTDRNGQDEIWLETPRSGWVRPLVGREAFPDEEPYMIDEPAFSADGARIAYQTWRAGAFGIWISSVAGGPPVRLAGDGRPQGAPTWSPDGSWIAHLVSEGSDLSLVKARVGSSEVLELLSPVAYVPPKWSADGAWIAAQDRLGIVLVPAEGGPVRRVAEGRWTAIVWETPDTLLALSVGPERTGRLSRIEVASGEETRIADLGPVARPFTFTLPYRGLALSADGSAVLTSVPRVGSDIWLLEGLDWRRDRGLRAWWSRVANR